LSNLTGNVTAPERLAQTLKGHDAVVSSVGFRQAKADQFVDAVRRSEVRRYVAVGGAGSLQSDVGSLLLDSPHFPAEYREEALAGKAFLEEMRRVRDLDWTVLSPSALFTPGQRTGTFRLGQDTLLTDRDGKSWISYEDFAVALFDEIEQPRHIRQRLTVGY
jgi:putative NADH-flavin reductase